MKYAKNQLQVSKTAVVLLLLKKIKIQNEITFSIFTDFKVDDYFQCH